MHNDSPMDVIAAQSGGRIRVTWPNGHQMSGDVTMKTGSRIGLKPGYEPATYAVMSGHGLVGGEFLTAVKIERMGTNGRYSQVWEQA